MSKSRSGAQNFFKHSIAVIAIAFAAPAGAENVAHKTMVGGLMIENAFSRETLPNQPVAGAFMTVTNTSGAADRLIGGVSSVAGRVEIHEMAMQGDVMKMRAMADGLDMPAGETVELKPGGFHVMMFDLNSALKEGDEIEITLEFVNAGQVTVPVVVYGKTAKKAHGAHEGHKAHSAHSH